MGQSWDAILLHEPRPDEPLHRQIDALFAQQRATWPALREGEAALAQLQRTTLSSDGASIVVQVNPARRRSTHAQTDARSVAARACFLCPQKMPSEERGVAFADLVVLPNPYPILPRHCTIAGRDHAPQRLAGRIGDFLRLAADLGPAMVALYNGPRCGASAPDHLHFQAACAAEIPILAEIAQRTPERRVLAHASFGRSMIIVRGDDARRVQDDLERAIAALSPPEAGDEEPMLNLLARRDGDCYTAILFPRAAHRPASYFATGRDRLAVSPAILEMCGILVTTEAEHAARLDAAAARAIYAEVSVNADRCAEVAAALA